MLTMLDQIDYITQGNGYQGNGNGYHNLEGNWLTYYKVAKCFTHKVKREDRGDFLHDLLLAMARVKTGYDAKGKELTEGGLVRIACYEVAQYWRNYYNQRNGIDCGRCTNRQRQKCKKDDLYRECPKAVKTESLDRIVEDGNGDSTPLHELIANDKAVDLVAMLDARFTLQGYPRQAVLIAYKRYSGYPLEKQESNYLRRFAKRTQKSLIK
jgi:hypothetical protein